MLHYTILYENLQTNQSNKWGDSVGLSGHIVTVFLDLVRDQCENMNAKHTRCNVETTAANLEEGQCLCFVKELSFLQCLINTSQKK